MKSLDILLKSWRNPHWLIIWLQMNLKPSIKALFSRVAEYLHNQEPILEKQSLYSKTLLGVKGAKDIEKWVNENKAYLRNLKSNEDWINSVWNLFSSQLDDKFFHLVEPQYVPIGIVKKWISGDSYKDIFSLCKEGKCH